MQLRVDQRDHDTGEIRSDPLISEGHYRRLRWFSVVGVSSVAVIPLVIMTVTNYHQYREAFHLESIRPISRLTANAKGALESFLSERLSALMLVSRAEPLEELTDSTELGKLLVHMKRAFGGFVDLGLIDHNGRQVAYAGPYKLEGRDYRDHDWYHEVTLRGVHISEIFLGHRHLPHFVIAVSHDTVDGRTFVLRAAIDTENIVKQITHLSSHDAFLINREGVLQTPSRHYGDVMQKMTLLVPPDAQRPEVIETLDADGLPLVLGYASIERSPFVVMLLHKPTLHQASWLSLRRNLMLFLVLSILLILGVVFFASARMVRLIRQSDLRRATVYHKMEYTNKMAAIGRLAAGVAHEINNPLAIINEKAGLMRDLLALSPEPPAKEKLIGITDSVLSSVERCGVITHRLLGFARHMDIETEEIDLELLIKGVLTFLEKEASYRNLQVEVRAAPGVPTIKSDRGQLQQVFLNIINNAFAAVGKEHGAIEIEIDPAGDEHVAVRVRDNGMGISEENLTHIFEPFFTTKRGAGTGLGLSITYGIIQKLRGKVEVESTVGEGTCFAITLPLERAG